MKKALFAALLLLPSAGLLADECSEATTQADMNQCAATAYKTADSALNKTYQQVMKRLGAEQKAQLQTAQKRWISFRDADCDFMTAGSRGGSVNPMLTARCLQSKTEQRTKELQSLLQCEEGDISCQR